MNTKRRIDLLKIVDLLDEVISDEQDAYDNMPEGIQESEKGKVMEEGLDNLNEARELLDSCC